MTADPVPSEPQRTPYRDHALAYFQAGWTEPLPLPPRAKANPPKGFTGWQTAPSFADVYAWTEGGEGDGNIALRLPDHIIGLDVDAYGDKPGAATLAAKVAEWGPLPHTWLSTSRDDAHSGIRLFRVAPGLRWPGQLGPGVEIIQRRHRYAVVWPSIHPEGRTYRWVRPDGLPSTELPDPDDLPLLPERWVAGLTGGRGAGEAPPRNDLGSEAASGWLIGRAEPTVRCRRIEHALATALAELPTAGSAHDATTTAVMRLVSLAGQGHTGVGTALAQLREAFLDVVTTPGRSRRREPGEADREWARSLVGAVNRASADPSIPATPAADPCDPGLGILPPGVDQLGPAPAARTAIPAAANLAEEFWAARPEFGHVRLAAHARCTSADAVFAAVLARLSATCDPDLRFDSGIGRPASLNLFVALIGPSGAGKSTAVSAAAELLPVPHHLSGFRDGVGLGSGEGVIEQYLGDEEIETGETYKGGPRNGQPKTKTVKTQVRRNVFMLADEGEMMTKIGQRDGATVTAVLRSAWGGEQLGQANASRERDRHLDANSYALGLVVNYQRGAGQALLADADTGTPQRFLFATATDPSIPDQPPAHPGALRAHLGYEGGPLVWTSAPKGLTGTIAFAETIKARLRAEQLRKVRGGGDGGDPLDAHAPLLRCKLAALLHLLHRHPGAPLEVGEEDWRLAGVLLDSSRAVRAELVGYGREQVRQAVEEKADREVVLATRKALAASGADQKVERLAVRLAQRVQAQREMSRSEARRSLRSAERSLFDEALDRAVQRGWLALNDEETRVSAGSVAVTA